MSQQRKYYLHACTVAGCYFYCQEENGNPKLIAQNAGGILLAAAMTEAQCVDAVAKIIGTVEGVIQCYTVIESLDVLTPAQKKLLKVE